MNRERREAINQFADDIREVLGQNSIPIDPEKVVIEILGGQIIEKIDLEFDTDAIIRKSDDGQTFIIEINPDQSDLRRRFTLAHELGHLFLHMNYADESKWRELDHWEDTLYARQARNETEYEANEFAAAFLMPKEKFKEIANDNKTEDGEAYRLKPIAEKFKVSIDAVRNRGRWLRIFSWED